jgi:hypothetical protein
MSELSHAGRTMQTPLIFLHMPKTGGSTLTAQIKLISFPVSTIPMSISRWEDDVNNITKVKNEFSHVSFVHGHSAHLAFDLFPKATRFVMLRNPIERALSHFFMIKPKNGDENTLADIIDRKLVYRQMGIDSFHLFSNFQTKLLSKQLFGKKYKSTELVIEHCKEILDSCTIGITEMYDASLACLSAQIDTKIPEAQKEKVNKSRPKSADLAPYIYNKVRDANAIDLHLYAYALEKFETQIASMRPHDKAMSL